MASASMSAFLRMGRQRVTTVAIGPATSKEVKEAPLMRARLRRCAGAAVASEPGASIARQMPPPPPSPRTLEPSAASGFQGATRSDGPPAPPSLSPSMPQAAAGWSPPPPPPPPLVQATSQGAALASAVPPPPPPPAFAASSQASSSVPRRADAWSSAVPRDPPEFLAALEALGFRICLMRHWDVLEALQKEERFDCAQIVAIFDACVRVTETHFLRVPLRPAAAAAARASSGTEFSDEDLPLGTRLVQLFSNFVCERITTLGPNELTVFVKALTGPALPMDEFWLFMMAKRIQDTVDAFSAAQVVTIATRYSNSHLEDEEFFAVLSGSILRRVADIGPALLAEFLLACGKVRYLDEKLCSVAFPMFENRKIVSQLRGQVLADVLSAASLLDQQFFRPSESCRLLTTTPCALQSLVRGQEGWASSLLYSVSLLRHPAMLKLLLPKLLSEIESFVRGRLPSGKRQKGELHKMGRRVILLGLCGAFSVPRASSWSLAALQGMQQLLNTLDARLPPRGVYEPASSSFHLEVAAVLDLLEVRYKVEHKQQPFCLDLAIFPSDTSETSPPVRIPRREPSKAWNMEEANAAEGMNSEVVAASMDIWNDLSQR
eukprot:TRINITY_DN17853_c0_g5_i1.p1 TRINITY_DN17853_c0_g5~~TRINITY_DN17853_c0_g5_i1.p1  ORF type:complete len:606 (+),score=107.61 TRINITY_DN17853_c0_g5_i1:74-1891(+)